MEAILSDLLPQWPRRQMNVCELKTRHWQESQTKPQMYSVCVGRARCLREHDSLLLYLFSSHTFFSMDVHVTPNKKPTKDSKLALGRVAHSCRLLLRSCVRPRACVHYSLCSALMKCNSLLLEISRRFCSYSCESQWSEKEEAKGRSWQRVDRGEWPWNDPWSEEAERNLKFCAESEQKLNTEKHSRKLLCRSWSWIKVLCLC